MSMLHARCWDRLAVTDIAAVLGCTPNAVSVRLHEAGRRLMDQLLQTDSVRRWGHVV